MRLSVLVLVVSLACSTSSAMWRPPVKAESSASTLIKKLEVVAIVAVGLYLLLSDDGIIASLFEEPRRFPRDYED